RPRNGGRDGLPPRPAAPRARPRRRADDPRAAGRLPGPGGAVLRVGPPSRDPRESGMVRRSAPGRADQGRGHRPGRARGPGCMDPDGTSGWRAEAATAWESDRRRIRSWDRMEPAAGRPLFRPAPRSAMVFPLVVLVAVLPGLVALNAWDLTPPGPLWGLRGLAVLDGLVLDQVPATGAIRPVQEASAYRLVAFPPPLDALAEAALVFLHRR